MKTDQRAAEPRGGNSPAIPNTSRLSPSRLIETLGDRDTDQAKTADGSTGNSSIHTPGGATGRNQAEAMAMVLETHTRMVSETATTLAVVNPLDQSNAAFMGDAPACDVCGSITVRNGSCYKCMNCGQSMGCS
jgi:ribonucleoside-diphosphate reductase alpha chain